MDEYTRKTQEFLDRRFMRCNEDGVYYAHQPIYGFRIGPAEPDIFDRYIRTYQILDALGSLDFETLLDVGSAEGYKAALAARFFGVKAAASDLSPEACRRATEIFGIEAVAADVHHLPFKDGEFDVVLCSETLEHVTDYRVAADEILRVAKQAAVITVPHDSLAVVEDNVRSETPHAHIHAFDETSFDFYKERGYTVDVRKMLTRRLRLPEVLIEAAPRQKHELTRYPEAAFKLYNASLPVLRRIFGKRVATLMIDLDQRLAKGDSYSALLFLICKPGYTPAPGRNGIRPREIVDFSVPFHRLATNSGRR